ncbi:hypothetical protein AURDEDRAFT_161341 [Auricularia subglabra TFB-10046 SS5]|nr:hypothetical protein AURDEDRAFT_161341 [Auricularia subglabra TFB-10046 SS5]
MPRDDDPLLSAISHSVHAYLGPRSATTTSTYGLEAAIDTLLSTVKTAVVDVSQAWKARPPLHRILALFPSPRATPSSTMPREEDPTISAISHSIHAYLEPTVSKAARTGGLEAEIISVLETVHAAVADVSQAWNARTDRVWSKLPAELRAACFKELPMADKLSIAKTSRGWRANALRTPELWNTIVYPSAYPRTMVQLRAMLRRSSTRSLTLTVAADYVNDDGLLDELLRHIDRVRSFSITGLGDVTTFTRKLLLGSPLLQLKTLNLEPRACLEGLSAGMGTQFPSLRSFRLLHPGSPGLTFTPMQSLQDLTCAFAPWTEGGPIFACFPNLQRLRIEIWNPILGEPADKIHFPEGAPPASLRYFDLDNDEDDGILDLERVLEAWNGACRLEFARFTGFSMDIAPIAALYASMKPGPWKLNVTSWDPSWIELSMSTIYNGTANALQSTFVVRISGNTSALLGCQSSFSNLTELDAPAFVLEIFIAGDISLPSVTVIRVRQQERDFEPEWDAVERLCRLADRKEHVMRVPSLRAVTFIYESDYFPVVAYFAADLRSAMEFTAAQLESITFFGVTAADAEKVRFLKENHDVDKELRDIAREIYWNEEQTSSDSEDDDNDDVV